jgi:pimeloyl-ACP methyl ester carboxylesterase
MAPVLNPPVDPVVEYHHAQVNGLRMFYRAAGDPGRPAFVLLHGFPSSSHMFRDLIPRLARHFRVVAPDLPGFGHSDAPDWPHGFAYTFDALAVQVEALISQLGLMRYHLYLHDYGGPVGWRIAARQPRAVLGQVVQNANAYSEGVSAAAAAVLLPLWERGDETGARQMLQAATTRMQYTAGARHPSGLSPDAWLHDQALLDRPGNELRQMALFRDYASNLLRYDDWQAYFREHQPRTLVVWGRGDPFFTVEGAQAFRRDLPKARIEWLEGGHFALEEYAPQVAALIVEHFGTQAV